MPGRKPSAHEFGAEPMTYCVAMRLNRGLVFAADTRTNAGVDNIAQFRKIHYWCEPGDRVHRAAGRRQPVADAVGRQPVERAAGRARARVRQPAQRALDVPRRAARRRRGAQRARRSTGPRSIPTRRGLPARSSSAARSSRSRRACSRSIRRATSSRRPTTRPISRSASTSTASPSSTAWRSRPCGWARRPS